MLKNLKIFLIVVGIIIGAGIIWSLASKNPMTPMNTVCNLIKSKAACEKSAICKFIEYDATPCPTRGNTTDLACPTNLNIVKKCVFK